MRPALFAAVCIALLLLAVVVPPAATVTGQTLPPTPCNGCAIPTPVPTVPSVGTEPTPVATPDGCVGCAIPTPVPVVPTTTPEIDDAGPGQPWTPLWGEYQVFMPVIGLQP